MNFDWLKSGIAPLDNLLSFLHEQSKPNDVLKKQVLMELRKNLNIFKNAFLNNVSPDTMIDLLCNDAIQEAIKQNFTFKKLKTCTIEPYHVHNDRNKKYIGWTAEQLIDKIDEINCRTENIEEDEQGKCGTGKEQCKADDQ